jgi:AraC-like DNA-binding protein
LHYITRGSGYLYVGEEKIHLKRASIFFVYADKPHRYHPNRVDPWDYIWVNFMGENLIKLFSLCGIAEEKPYVTGLSESESETVSNLFLQLLDSHIASPDSTLKVTACLLHIISLLITRLKLNETRYLSDGCAIRDALVFMNCNYRIDIGVRDIARNANVSESYLYSLFSRKFGISPKHYLIMFRIATACELLRNGAKRVNEAAAEVGFNDSHYFSRCFSEIKGISPREYIKSCDCDEPWAFLTELGIQDYR